MNRLRTARLVATLLLSLQGYALARAAGPQVAACHCAAHCGCSLRDAPSVDDSKVPPCHRHKAHRGPSGPCLRVGCDMPQPALTMLLFLGLPAPEPVLRERAPMSEAVAERGPPAAPMVDVLRRPPKASV